MSLTAGAEHQLAVDGMCGVLNKKQQQRLTTRVYGIMFFSDFDKSIAMH